MLYTDKMNPRLQIKFLAFFCFLVVSLLPVVYLYIEHFSLSRYTWILRDVRQQDIFVRTVFLGVGAAVLSVVLGVSVAVVLEYGDLPYKSFLKAFIVFSLIIPPYITSISYLAFMGRTWVVPELYEPLTETASVIRRDFADNLSQPLVFQRTSLNLTADYSTILQQSRYLPFKIYPYSIEYAVLLLALCYYPLVFLMTSCALRNIDTKLIDSARLIQSPIKVVSSISIPLAAPQIIISALFVYIFSVSELGVPAVFRINTVTNEVFNHFAAFYDTGQALALSIPLVVSITLLLTIAQIIKGRKPLITMPASGEVYDLLRLNKLQKMLCILYVLVVICFSSLIPLAMLFIHSRYAFIEALDIGLTSLINSLILASLCSTVMLVPGFLVSYFWKKNNLTDYVILLPLITPAAALGIGMIYIWNNKYTGFVYGSFLILLFGYVARFLPLIIETLTPFIAQIPESVEEAGRIAGASFMEIAVELITPLARNGLYTAWLVGFILCMRELELSVILTPPGFQTLPNRIFTLYHYGDIEKTTSLSIFLVALIIIPYLLMLTINNRTLKCRISR